LFDASARLPDGFRMSAITHRNLFVPDNLSQSNFRNEVRWSDHHQK
jgi:hypothetical protein